MNSKEQKIKNLNPNDPASDDSNIFGLPFTESESELVIIPVPWEVTVSYRTGTANAPEAILQASKQIDLYEPLNINGWHKGIFLQNSDKSISSGSKKLRKIVQKYLDLLTSGTKLKKKEENKVLSIVNKAGYDLKEIIRKKSSDLISKNKLVAMIGGDHSTPLGLIEALANHHGKIGILQLDAHCDLRNSYEGFTYSHASIMYNVLQLKGISKLVQVGIRDFCQEEVNLFQSDNRIKVFFNADLSNSKFKGENWLSISKRIIDELPEKVYISFDIDGLDPKLCPNTGTPVPGGLEFEEAVFLMNLITESGRKIVGFDLNEVAPGRDEWDANVGARMLYKMCNIFLKSAHKSVDKIKSTNNNFEKELSD
jgi:agmatinase